MARRIQNNPEPEQCKAVVDKVRKVDAILTADIHLRDDQPVCRLDNYWEAQARKIAWLRDLQKQHNCHILDAGDVFGKSRPSPMLLGWAIRNLPNSFFSIPGNHDLPEHSLENLHKSGFDVLRAADVIHDITGTPYTFSQLGRIIGLPWGVEWQEWDKDDFYDIAVMHVMVYHGQLPWPGCTDASAEELMGIVKARLILTGHNHTPFVVERKGQLLVNPGSLMRSTAAQADFKPRVYLYCADDNTVQPVYVPIEAGVVSREHLDVTKDKEERLSVFVSRLSQDVELGLNFQENMNRYLTDNRVRKGVRRIIEEGMA